MIATDSELNPLPSILEPNFVPVSVDLTGGLVEGPGGAISKAGDNKSANYDAGKQGWIIRSNGDVEFNTGTFRGALVAASMNIPGPLVTSAGLHVSSAGDMWWGTAGSVGAATIKITSAGAATMVGLTATSASISGSITTSNLSATGGTIGGWTIAAGSISNSNLSMDNTNNRIRAAVDSNNYVEMYGNVGAQDSYIRGQVSGGPSFFFGYRAGGTYNIVNNLLIAQTINATPYTYPYWAFDPGGGSPTAYLRVLKYNSAGSIAEWNFDNSSGTRSDFWSDRIGGMNYTTVDFQNNGYATIDASWRPTTNSTLNLGAEDFEWAEAYIDKILGNSGNNVIDFGNAGRIITNQMFGSASGGGVSLGDATYYWNDVSYKTLTDRGCLGWFDAGVKLQDGTMVSDTEALLAIKKDEVKKTIYGQPMLDYTSLPKDVYKVATKMVDGKEVVLPRDANGQPYDINEKGETVIAQDGAETTALLSIMLGAIKELTLRIKELEKK